MKRPVLAVAVVTAFALTTGVVQAADPSTAECLAATESSVKLGNEHKLRAERAQFLVCAAASCPADIRKDCASQAESVSAQIPTIIFAAKDPSGADLSAVKVTMDGEVLTERLAGIALSIDPGEHTFTFETAGQSPVTTKFMIQQAQKDRRELVTFGSPVPVPDTSSPQGVRESMGEPASSTGANVRRTAGWVVGGIGLAGIVTGIALVAVGSGKRSDCDGGVCSTTTELNNYNSGTPLLNAGYGLLVAGGVMTATGLVLWITSPRGSNGHVAQEHNGQGLRVGFAPNGIVLSGGFQ
jgi:hypothetical protein